MTKTKVILFLLILITACKKENRLYYPSGQAPPYPSDTAGSYYPLKDSNYWFYNMFSVTGNIKTPVGKEFWRTNGKKKILGAGSFFIIEQSTDSFNFIFDKTYHQNDYTAHFIADKNEFRYTFFNVAKIMDNGATFYVENGVPNIKGVTYNYYSPKKKVTTKFGTLDCIKSTIDSIGPNGTGNEYNRSIQNFYTAKNIGTVRFERMYISKKPWNPKPDTTFILGEIDRFKVK